MLDYAPDGLTGGLAAMRGQEMTVVWSEHLADPGALLRLIAASRATAPGRDFRCGHRMFNPERLSGFCASG